MRMFVFESKETDFRALFIADDIAKVTSLLRSEAENFLEAVYGTSKIDKIIAKITEVSVDDPALFILAHRCQECGDGYSPTLVSRDIARVIPPCDEKDELSAVRLQ